MKAQGISRKRANVGDMRGFKTQSDVGSKKKKKKKRLQHGSRMKQITVGSSGNENRTHTMEREKDSSWLTGDDSFQ